MTTHDDELRDPPRLADDHAAPASLRTLVREGDLVRPPALPDDVRQRVRRSVAARTTPSRAPWIAVSLTLALAAAALLVWLGAPPPTSDPAQLIGSELDAASSVDAGPREATIDAGPTPPRERVPFLDVSGNGCGLEVRVLLTELDADVTSVALVLDEVTSPDPSGASQPVDCEGRVVRELDARLFREGSVLPSSIALPLTLGAPDVVCGHTYTVTACVRDTLGRLATEEEAMARPVATHDLEGNRSVDRVETPSGPAALADLEAGHVVTSFMVQTTPSWTTPGGLWPALVEAQVVSATHDPEELALTTIRLSDGRVLRVRAGTEVWVAGRGFQPAEALTEGAPLVTPSTATESGLEPELRVAEVVVGGARGRSVALDVTFPDAFFLDGVLVHDASPSRHTGPSPRAATLSPSEPVRAMPEPSWDCSIATRLVVDALPDDARSIAIVYAPHRGRAGLSRALDCDAARLGLELPRSLIDAIPATHEGTRVLSAEVPGWDEAGGDWHGLDEQHSDVDASGPTRGSVECSSAYDVMACVRGGDGALRALPGAEGRWTLTGPACFARGTEVTTREGLVAIESLGPGDQVTSRDPHTGQVREVRVRSLVPRGIRPIRAITLASGRVLEVTYEHPLLDAETLAFRTAASFGVGDRLLDVDGHEVEVIEIAPGGSAPVYDLSVDGPHTFVAGGVVVHNY